MNENRIEAAWKAWHALEWNSFINGDLPGGSLDIWNEAASWALKESAKYVREHPGDSAEHTAIILETGFGPGPHADLSP